MDLTLPAEVLAVRDRARSIAQEVLWRGARERDRTKAFPMAEVQQLAQAGFMGVTAPVEAGGLGFGAVAYALALHEIAGACASTAVTMAVTNMVVDMVVRFGTPEQQRWAFSRLLTGERPVGAFCLSEPHSGSDAADLRAKGELQSDGSWRLSGTKMWVSSGAPCSVALVMARTGPSKAGGITAFLVDTDQPGWQPQKAEDKMGLRASNTAMIAMEDVLVPGDRLLGGEGAGFKVAMTALDGGRIGIGAQALGIARTALRLAAQPLGRAAPSQAQLLRVADAATALDAGWLMMLRGAWLREQGRKMTREAAMAKVVATESAWRAVELASEIAGEAGLLGDVDLERLVRDVRVTRIYEGTSEIQRHVIAREILSTGRST